MEERQECENFDQEHLCGRCSLFEVFINLAYIFNPGVGVEMGGGEGMNEHTYLSKGYCLMVALPFGGWSCYYSIIMCTLNVNGPRFNLWYLKAPI